MFKFRHILWLLPLLASCQSQEARTASTPRSESFDTAYQSEKTENVSSADAQPQTAGTTPQSAAPTPVSPTPLPVAITPIPIGGSHLRCTGLGSDALSCAITTEGMIQKAVAISGPQGTVKDLQVQSGESDQSIRGLAPDTYSVQLRGANFNSVWIFAERIDIAFNHVKNPSFEDSGLGSELAGAGGWQVEHVGCGSKPPELGTQSESREAFQGQRWGQIEGRCFRSKDGAGQAVLYQDITYEPGRLYLLRFAIRRSVGSAPGNLIVSSATNKVLDLAGVSESWEEQSLLLTPTQSIERLSFLNENGASLEIDDVRVIDVGPAL